MSLFKNCVLFFVVIYAYSCKLKHDEDRHLAVKENDTSFVFHSMLDSLFKVDNSGFDNPLNPKKYLIKDTIVFIRDSVFSKYLDTVNFKIKILDQLSIFEKFSKKNSSISNEVIRKEFANFFSLNVFRAKFFNFGDTVVAGIFTKKNVFSKFDSEGNFRKKITGGYYTLPDSCAIISDWNYYLDNCFLKQGSVLIKLNRKTPMIGAKDFF